MLRVYIYIFHPSHIYHAFIWQEKPNDPVVLHNLGVALTEEARYQEAEEKFLQAWESQKQANKARAVDLCIYLAYMHIWIHHVILVCILPIYMYRSTNNAIHILAICIYVIDSGICVYALVFSVNLPPCYGQNKPCMSQSCLLLLLFLLGHARLLAFHIICLYSRT